MKEKTPTKEEIDELVKNSPSVRSAQTELAATKLNKTYTATSSYLPSLNLSANVSHLHVRRRKNAADGWLGHRHRVPLERPRRRPPANRSQNRQGARVFVRNLGNVHSERNQLLHKRKNRHHVQEGRRGLRRGGSPCGRGQEGDS